MSVKSERARNAYNAINYELLIVHSAEVFCAFTTETVFACPVPSIYGLDYDTITWLRPCEHTVFCIPLTIDWCEVLNEVPFRSVYLCIPIHSVFFRVTT